MVRTEVSRLRSFGQFVEFQATRSVDLLRAIDDVIYGCCVERDQLIALTGAAHEFIQALRRVETVVDPDGTVLKNLEQARDALDAAYKAHQRRRESAARDPRLNSDDGVVDAFDGLLDAMAAAHNALNDLCWALGEHDADFDEVLDGEFASADAMIKALRG